MGILNNRELAIVIWSIIVTTFILKNKKMRESVSHLFFSFVAKKLSCLWLIMIAYIALIIYALFVLKFWDFSDTKNTLIWIFATSFVNIFKVFKTNSQNNKSISFEELALDNLKLAAFIQVLVGFYSYEILTELILVPFSTLLVILLSYSELHHKDQLIHKFLESILTIFGLLIIIHAFYKFVIDPTVLLTLQTAFDFLLPIALTLLFSPFLFLLFVYLGYENTFIRINCFIADSNLRWKTKLSAILLFNFRIALLKRWVEVFLYKDITSYQEVRDAFKLVFKIKKLEKARCGLSIQDGWSPYVVKDFLTSEGLKTNNYNPPQYPPDYWFCCSPYLKIGESLFMPNNNITYSVYGNESEAKILCLYMNINNRNDGHIAHEKFLELTQIIYEKSTKFNFPKDLREMVLNGKSFEKQYPNFNVILKKEKWTNGVGYSIKFEVSCLA